MHHKTVTLSTEAASVIEAVSKSQSEQKRQVLTDIVLGFSLLSTEEQKSHIGKGRLVQVAIAEGGKISSDGSLVLVEGSMLADILG